MKKLKDKFLIQLFFIELIDYFQQDLIDPVFTIIAI